MLRLLLPDNNIIKDGFHDVVVENLIGSSTWRSRHVSPSDVIALRRRWPRAVFQVMKERCIELEDYGEKRLLDSSGHIDTPFRAIALSAKLEQKVPWIHTCVTISDWASSDVAQSSGARCGKAPSESAGIISTINTVVRF